MFRKSTLLAVVASAALGLAILTPTSASARHGGGGGHGGGMHGGHGGHGGGGHIGHHHPRPHWHVRYHRPIWYPGVRTVGYTVARPVVSTPGPCTCLSKEYTQDGMVVFQDRCTNEAAAAQIGGQQQSQAQPGNAQPMPQQ